MQDGYVRYALCWVPKLYSDLAEFGCAWTGWCPEKGMKVSLSRDLRHARKLAGPTGMTGRLGLNAHLTKPFTLRTDGQLWSLENALNALAGKIREVPICKLEVQENAGKLTLAPRSQERIEQLATELGAAMESFGIETRDRFEIALTDTLMGDAADGVANALTPILTSILSRPVIVSDIAMMGDPGDGRPWRVTERYPLGPTAMRQKGPDGMIVFGPDHPTPGGGNELLH